MEPNPIVDDGFKYKPTVTNLSENVSQTYYQRRQSNGSLCNLCNRTLIAHQGCALPLTDLAGRPPGHPPFVESAARAFQAAWHPLPSAANSCDSEALSHRKTQPLRGFAEAHPGCHPVVLQPAAPRDAERFSGAARMPGQPQWASTTQAR